MKKILVFLLAVISLSFCSILPGTNKACAYVGENLSGEVKQSISNELNNFAEVNENFKIRSARTPGSVGEKNSAEYIKQVMDVLETFEAVNNPSTIDGIQSFEFTSLIDNCTYTSQNVIYKKESKVKTNYTVVLSAHYDTTYVEDTEKPGSGTIVLDGINDNAGSVALLIAFAKELDINSDLPFNIEIVFFGASTNNYDGSRFYMRGVSDDKAKNILLNINFDKIAIGRFNYMYVNEFMTPQEKYFFKLAEGQNMKKLQNINTLDFSKDSPNGLNYTHFGLESDHAIFMARNINTLNFFSGDYENALTFGLSEYNNNQNITYTENDNYEYIEANYIDYLDNLANVYLATRTILTDENFVSEMLKQNNSENFYKFWTNERLAVFITTILCILFIFAYYLIYLSLQKKSLQRISGKDVNSIVVKITTNLGDSNEDLSRLIDQKIKNDTSKSQKNAGENQNQSSSDKGDKDNKDESSDKDDKNDK